MLFLPLSAPEVQISATVEESGMCAGRRWSRSSLSASADVILC